MIGDVPPTAWKIYWTCYVVIGFGAAEWYALKTIGVQGTFSYTLWWWFGTGASDRDIWNWIARGVFLLIVVWGVQHLMTGQNLWTKWFG